MNYDEHIKPSANVIEASYFNIFECGKNVLDKVDVTYQSAFTASEKPSTLPSVPPAAYYVSPLKKKYWDVQTDNLKKMMAGMNDNYILDAIYLLRHENPEYHESIINRFISEYDEFNQSCEGDTDSAESEELKSRPNG